MQKFALHFGIVIFGLMFFGAANAITCASGQYDNGGVCTACPPYVDATNGYQLYMSGGATIFSDAGATSSNGCYVSRTSSGAGDWWLFEKENKGYWRTSVATGRCYYGASKRYNNCNVKKYFSECFAGYYINNSLPMNSEYSNSCTICPAGGYTAQYSAISMIGIATTYHYQTSCSLCTAGTYSTTVGATTAATCLACPTGYAADTSLGKNSISKCAIKTTAGNYIATANTTTLTTCPAGYYCPGNLLISYGSTGGSIACAIGSYSAAGASACTACPGGKTTSVAGKASCDANCSNSANISSWTAPAWLNTNNTVTGICAISGCSGGYYLNTNACIAVGPGYWSENNSANRTTCAAGTTTIGYGSGADEAADCGKILNIGDKKIYLRSAKKTTPSLVLSVGGAIYYGNMALNGYYCNQSPAKKLYINSGSSKYTVYDDVEPANPGNLPCPS